MSMGVAFATSVFKTYNDKVRAQAEAEREAAIKEDERKAGFSLATFKAGLEEGNIRLQAKLDRELSDAEYKREAQTRLQAQLTAQLNAMSDENKLIAFQNQEFLDLYNSAFGSSFTVEMGKMANALANADSSSIFGKTTIGFGKVYDDDQGIENLNQLNDIVGNPDEANRLLTAFKTDTAGAEQLVNFIDMELGRRGQYIYLTKSGRDEATKQIKSPAYATFDEYKPLLSFREQLASQAGVETRTQRHIEVANAMKVAAGGREIGSDEIFVSKKIKDDSGQMVIRGEFIKEQVPGYADQLEELAQINGFANRHVMINNITSIGISGDPVDALEVLREHTIPLKNAGAEQLLTAKGALPNVVDEVSTLLTDASPSDNTAEQVNALVALIPLPESYESTMGIRGQYPAGEAFLKTRSIKASEMISKNTFANNAADSINQIIANYEPDKNGGSIKTGAAGLLQRVGLGIFAAGGQVDQLFGGFDPATDFEEGTSAASLAQVVADVTGKSLTDKLGENDALMIALAYQMARAEDSNGRLSDADLKIQLDLLKGSGFFDNRNITRAKLNTLKTKFERIKQDTDYYAAVAKNTGGITPLEAREFDAYIIVEKARKHRRRKTVSATGSTDTRIRFNEDDYKPATQDFMPVDGSEFFYDNRGVVFERKDGSDFITKVEPDDTRLKLIPTNNATPQAETGQAAAATVGAEDANSVSQNNQPAANDEAATKPSFSAKDLAGIQRKPLPNGNFEVTIAGQTIELKPVKRQGDGGKVEIFYQRAN